MRPQPCHTTQCAVWRGQKILIVCDVHDIQFFSSDHEKGILMTKIYRCFKLNINAILLNLSRSYKFHADNAKKIALTSNCSKNLTPWMLCNKLIAITPYAISSGALM